MKLEKIVSGGQTGVDRAALDVCIEAGFPCGGWCPAGRLAEDGRLDPCYPLTETPDERYDQRTEWNVRDSDGTLILNTGKLEGGSLYTKEMADRHGKTCLVVDLDEDHALQSAVDFIETHSIKVLNLAGPRESKRPGIYEQSRSLLKSLIDLKT